MRILISSRSLSLDRGIGRYLKGLVPAMLQLDPDLEIVIHSENEWPKEFGHPRITRIAPGFDRLREKRPGPFLWDLIYSVAASRKVRPDLIHFPSNSGTLLTRRQVITVHDAIPLGVLSHMGYQSRPKVLAKTYRRARHLIADTEFTKGAVSQLLNGVHAPISTVHIGLDDGFRKQEYASIPSVDLATLGIRKPYILYAGGSDARKNVICAIEAFGLLPDDLRNQFKFAMLCKWDNASLDKARIDKVKQRPGLLSHVLELNHVPDETLRALYSNAACFVFPSLYEGFGLPPLEAMSCKVPVVSSRIGAVEELVGDHARLVEPDNPQAFSNAMLDVLTNPPDSSLLTAASEHAKSFTWDRAARQTLDIYRMAL